MVGESLLRAGKGVVPFSVCGVDVFLRKLTMGDLLKFKASRDAGTSEGAALVLVSLSVCEAGGTPALAPEQVAELPVDVVNALTTKIAELNGFGETDPGNESSTKGPN